ncbi:MAG: 4a-hydroxytetrahydrobiopterin dehydratase [Pseudomonadota bacterium]
MKNAIHQNRKALSATEIVTQLSKLNGEQALGWRLMDGALEKTFSFKNFHETMGFVNALAFIANTEDHHPDLLVSYGKCTVRFNTHDVKGISVSDFFCASKTDALFN